jgi:hypothetical protein
MDHRGRGDATRQWRVASVAGAVTAGLLWAGPGDVMAQTRDNPPSKAQDRMTGGQDLERRIRDVSNERITLGDGTVLFIPRGMAKQSDLKVGATVKAKYQDRNGQKVATAIQINPAGESGVGGSK